MKEYDVSSEIRLKNARSLLEHLGDGRILNISQKLDRNQSHVTQMIGKNPTKPITDKMARVFEEAFELPVGWLDNPWRETLSDIKELYEAIPIKWREIPKFGENPLAKVTGWTNFRVQVRTNLMYDSKNPDPWLSIPYGAYIIVDSKQPPAHTHLVVYQKTPSSEANIGQYIQDSSGERTIIVFNPLDNTGSVKLTDNSVINGVVRQIINTKTVLPIAGHNDQ